MIEIGLKIEIRLTSDVAPNICGLQNVSFICAFAVKDSCCYGHLKIYLQQVTLNLATPFKRIRFAFNLNKEGVF